MALNVYIAQRPDQSENGGIKRVLEAQYKYLPEFGINLVDNLNEAELTVGHVLDVPYKLNTPAIVHNHGMMWEEYFSDIGWAHEVNQKIVETIIRCQAYTVPSQWVRAAMARGLYQEPEVIYHGADVEEWYPDKEYGKYVLWNKARIDAVSNPDDMNQLAELCREVEFISTFGHPAPNVEIVGNKSNAEMKSLVQHAGVYLATARETMGIGTLEALACGVPVVGWDYGGQTEIIIQGETGYLAPYGDYQTLAEMVHRAMAERTRLGQNAREDAQTRWQWRDKVEQYASLYKRTTAWSTAPRPKVTVVVPAHNYAHYLRDALNSILAQTLQDFECLIIDDSSTDDTPEVAREYVANDIRFRYHRTHHNMGLSAVRNYGAAKALGKYITFLDADDILTPNSLALQVAALDQHRELHIVYGSLDLINHDTSNRRRNPFPRDFNWYHQMAHQNQVPTGAMMRREVIESSGGWRTRQWRAEDAEFWSRVTSFGFRAAKVTEETTLLYRLHPDSKGMQEWNNYPDRDGNWLANIAWHSANSAEEGRDFIQQWGDKVPRTDLVPFGSQGTPEANFWSVKHRQEPLVSIIVNYTDNQEAVIDTLDSLMGQTMDSWEVIVIDCEVQGFPYAQFVHTIREADELARGLFVIGIEPGQQLLSTALWSYLEQQEHPSAKAYIEKYSMPQAVPSNNGKVQMRYMGLNKGEKPIKVNGNVYRGARGKIVWVKAGDVKQLEQMNWQSVGSTISTPSPSTADARKELA